MPKGKVTAICGKICSGKTRYARSLREKEGGVILSTDEVTWDLTGNRQGEEYNELCKRVNAYLMKKGAEIASEGCNVILDWGFWTPENRRALTEYYREREIPLEWHYIDIPDEEWEENIRERNLRTGATGNGPDFYVDEGLKQKLLNMWSAPDESEINVRILFRREKEKK